MAFFFVITAWHGFQWYYVVYKSIPIPLQLPSGRLVLFLFFVSIRINVIILSLFKIIYLYSVISCATITFFSICTIHHDWLKNLMKRIYFWYLILKWEIVLFKKSLNIIITKNHNCLIEILWYKTGYTKRKILSSLKRPTWDRLYCCFCFKLLKVCWFILWWFVCNTPNSNVNKYSIVNISNSGVDKYYIIKKI
jgi:hypothetical protein